MRFFVLFPPLLKKSLRGEAEILHEPLEGNAHLINEDDVCDKHN